MSQDSIRDLCAEGKEREKEGGLGDFRPQGMLPLKKKDMKVYGILWYS